VLFYNKTALKNSRIAYFGELFSYPYMITNGAVPDN